MTEFTPLDVHEWSRTKDFDYFMEAGTQIHCCNMVDVSEPVRLLKERGLRFFIPMVYLIGRCMNEIDGFLISAERYPTPDDEPVAVRLERRDASFPVLNRLGNPINVIVDYEKDFAAFYNRAIAIADEAIEDDANSFAPGNGYYITSYVPLPFTDCGATSTNETMLIPLVVVGKCAWVGGRCVMPVSLTVHHAFCDGMQVAEFYNRLQAYCDNPIEAFGLR